MKYHDVIIIGGGITGTSIARELTRYRLEVALLEKEEELAFGVSKSNSGIIHPGTQNPPGSLKGRLCVQGNKLTRKISRELGADLKEVGELIVAFDEEQREGLERLKKDAESLGVPSLRVVGRAWLRKNEPNLNHEAVAALYAPTAGIVSPYRLVYDIAENAVTNGLGLYTRTDVEGIDRSGEDVFKVRTSRGEFISRYIVNAAGLYADKIAGMVGLTDFKITPRKGEEFILDSKRQDLTRHLIFPMPGKNTKGVLVIKTSDGNPMIGPTSEDIYDKEDLSTTDTGFEKIISSVKKLVPAIDGRDVIAYFSGLRPVAGDDFIIRHEDRVPGLVNVAGIQSPGLTASPAIALLVVDILKENGLGLKRKTRFQKYRPRTEHLFTSTPAKAGRLIEKDPDYGDIVCRCEMVSAREIKDAIDRGATTMDGIKFRTRAQAGRCHGSFCTTRIMKMLAEKTGRSLTDISKRGKGSELVKEERDDART